MSYQVLARKYRPSNFQELEGQQHVLQALINALDNNRLHHAYLFTGTRGTGKTTIARILAKCLNCEAGVTSTPCGSCGSCVEIAEGRSVDLIEIDAASRTGVDHMRELLDNVQYMPSVSRYKVYLIDEVHMLSTSSFNAMLKTLEEPPEHAKFLFATTDPKKLPVTVLSRSLQFNLKNLTPEQVVHYLQQVLTKEDIAFEEAALWQLGHAADGSMRDALSLTDQAISYGNNAVKEAEVRAMLGSIDQGEVFELLEAIIAQDGARLLSRVAALAEFAPDYAGVLDSLLAVLHRMAIAGAVPDALDNSQGDKAKVEALVGSVSPEQVQLLYQIGLIGVKDLPYAPSQRVGFEMVLLRMMSFGLADEGAPTPPSAKPAKATQPPQAQATPASQAAPSSQTAAKNQVAAGHQSPPKPSVTPNGDEAPKASTSTKPQSDPVADSAKALTEPETAKPEPAKPEPAKPEPTKPEPTNPEQAKAEPAKSAEPPALAAEHWPEILRLTGLGGISGSLAAHASLSDGRNGHCVLALGEQHAKLWNDDHQGRIGAALSELYGRQIKVSMKVGATSQPTPNELDEQQRQKKQAKAIEEISQDANVQRLIEGFGGKLDLDSVSPRA